MAYTRDKKNKVYGDGLDSFVSNIASSFATQMKARNAEDELNFNTQVLENNLSLDDQLAYRKDQLKRTTDDPEERARIRGEIASLKDRIEQKTFADAYTKQVTAYESGGSSVDSVISWLTDQRASATDPTIQASIDKELQTYQGKKFDLTKQMLTNQTEYALKDKSAQIVGDQITRVQAARAKALLAGDDTNVSSLDIQLQSLNQALHSNSIETAIKNAAVSTVSGASKSVDLLNTYNSNIASADTTSPVTIGGVTYANAKEFWTYTRDAYLADSSQSGFFPRIGDEQTTSLKVKNSNNTLTPLDISNSATTYNALYGRPELANYTAKIDATKQDSLQTAANYVAQKISDTYDNTLDINKAVADLNALKSQGVNVDAYFQKIITSATALKSTAINNIVQNAQTLMAGNPGMSIGDAVTQAVQKGSGITLAPNQIVNANPADVAKDVIAGQNNGTIAPDTRSDVVPSNQTGDLKNPAPLPGGTVTTPAPVVPPTAAPGNAAGGSYIIKTGDTLSSIAARNNTTVDALAKANNIADVNKIAAGATIKIPTAPTNTPNPGPTPLPKAPVVTPTTPLPSNATSTTTPAVKPVATPAPVANPTPTSQSPSAGSNTYVIKSGDTLGAIANLHGTTIADLAKLNNIVDVNKIQAGATLKIK